MRYLGLIGGMSWESTAVYYQLLNRGVAQRLGGLHSAPLLIQSVDFAEVAALQSAGDWSAAGDLLASAAHRLASGGAEALVLATNTMHHVADAIERAVDIPLLHIVDSTGAALRSAGVRRAGLLGTRYTMELPFWRERLAERFDVQLVIPESGDRYVIHRVIYDELCLGRIEAPSRTEYVDIIRRLTRQNAEAVIFGCTEITLLLSANDSPLPVFDTTALHAATAVDFIVGEAAIPAGAMSISGSEERLSDIESRSTT